MSNDVRRVWRHATEAGKGSIEHRCESNKDDMHDGVEQLDNYGVTAFPPQGVNEGVAVFIGGNSDHGAVISWLDKKFRPQDLVEGEVCIYDWKGNYIRFRAGKDVVINAVENIEMTAGKDITIKAAGKIVNDSQTVENSGDVKTQGATSSAEGYTGSNGGIAKFDSGLNTKELLVKDKDMGLTHGHKDVSSGSDVSGEVA